MLASNGDQVTRPTIGMFVASLIALQFLLPLISSAEATTIYLSATFNGEVVGDLNGTAYVGPLGRCPSGINCSLTFLPSTASVTGTVTETTGIVDFVTGPEPATIITQNFQGSSPLGSFTITTSSATPGSLSTSCQQNLLTCLSVNGFGGSTALGSPVTANLGLQPNYSGAPLNSTTLPIVYPLNFTSDGLFVGQSGGTFESGNTGIEPAVSCTVGLGGSIDSFGRCNVGSVQGVASTTPPTPPPTVQQLAAIANSAWSPLPASSVAGYNLLTTRFPAGGGVTSATAYSNGDLTSGGQIVIAAAGLEPNSVPTGFTQNMLLVDKSFASGQATSDLVAAVDNVAALVQQLASQYPTAQITLTGASEGGGINEIVGQETGLSTVTFAAPGAGSLLSSFSNDPNLTSLAAQSILTPFGSQTIGYRTTGDQLSLVGQPVGTTITLTPQGTQIPTLLAASLLNGPFGPILTIHSPKLLSQLLDNGPTTPGAIATSSFPSNFGDISEAAGQGGINLVPQGQQLQFVTNVAEGVIAVAEVVSVSQQIVQTYQAATVNRALTLDPPAGYSYSLVDAAGSPDFASIQLLIDTLLGGQVAGWELTPYVNGQPSLPEISTSGIFSFGPGVDRLDFFPIDANGEPIFYDLNELYVDVGFNEDGTFNGTLTTDLAPILLTNVPEPTSLLLLGPTLVSFGFIRGLKLALRGKMPPGPAGH